MKAPGNPVDRLLLQREMNGGIGESSTRGIYGSRTFVDNLDIVNELHGHSGCVNALCWSGSGNLLASGSDDTHINIHTRSSSTSTFSFTHSVSTGHTQNIFSVKFMPNSDDRTIVCCAGDSEVRVFDVEYAASANAQTGWTHSTQATSRLSYGETNTRVYRSHTDRVKRIVTESSPNLFLTCSEDGDVRQFDTREASHTTSRSRFHPRYSENTEDTRKPLISYRKAAMDLNTVSVSTSQPHYLALGGNHLYCFLHDRRMLRVKDNTPKCVRRFVPKKGESWSDNMPKHGHITACKISNAYPNELVASWSAGGIGLFDIHRSPDAEEEAAKELEREPSVLQSSSKRVRENGANRKGKAREGSSVLGSPSTSSERKRKRDDPRRSPSVSSAEAAWREEPTASQSRAAAQSNGESSNIGSLSESERMAVRIANSFVEIRKGIFGLNAPGSGARSSDEWDAANQSLSGTLKRAEECISLMDTYIMKQDTETETEPEPSQTGDGTSTPLPTLKLSLKKRRRRARKFVQSCGAVIKALTKGCTVPTPSHNYEIFSQIEGSGTDEEEWSYRFLRVVLGYVSRGIAGLDEVASRVEGHTRELYLENLLISASKSEETGIPDLEESPMIFESDYNAVRALNGVLTMFPSETTNVSKDAKRFWGWRVARALLMRLGTGIDYGFMEAAFGGLSAEEPHRDKAPKVTEERQTLRDTMRDVIIEDNIDEMERASHRSSTNIVDDDASLPGDEDANSQRNDEMDDATETDPLLDESDEDVEVIDEFDIDDDEEGDSEEDEDDENDDSDDDEDDDDDDNDDDDDDDGDGEAAFIRRLAGRRLKVRSSGPSDKLHSNVVKYENTKMFRGHCNVRTVKDVNFYGLDDEYVVSGSDCGHVFIWDKRTTELVQLLQGDGSVVNVVQGHPTEPLMAVSGIDSTVKIFSPDKQLQQQARDGVGINNSKKLQSRQKMSEKEDIIGENEVGRQSGLRDTGALEELFLEVLLPMLTARQL